MTKHRERIEEILNICLEQITENGDTVEQCLESYSEQATELAPLLRVAVSVAEIASTSKPSSEFARVAKYRLLSELDVKARERIKRPKSLWSWHRRWAVAVAVILALLLIGSGTVTASASSLPGDALYPVKTVTEKVQGFFAFGGEAKANFHIRLAQRRLDELKLLSERNRSIPQSLLNLMNAETDRAIEILSTDKPAKKNLTEKLVVLTFSQNTVLAKVIERIPPQAQSKLRKVLEEALERSKLAHTRAKVLRQMMPESGKLKMLPVVPKLRGKQNSTG